MNIDEYWLEFLIKNNLNQNIKYKDLIKLGDRNEDINTNSELIKNKNKKILVYSLLKFKNPKIDAPNEGDYFIVLNCDNNPTSIVEVIKTRIILFKNINYDIVKLEDNNQTLASWQKEKIDFFTKESKTFGYKFTYDMSCLICEIDKVF